MKTKIRETQNEIKEIKEKLSNKNLNKQSKNYFDLTINLQSSESTLNIWQKRLE